jgi:hypothetical protein
MPVLVTLLSTSLAHRTAHSATLDIAGYDGNGDFQTASAVVTEYNGTPVILSLYDSLGSATLEYESPDMLILWPELEVPNVPSGTPTALLGVAGDDVIRFTSLPPALVSPAVGIFDVPSGTDPTATVAYHTTDQKLFNEVLGSRGVSRASFANRAVSVSNRLDEIVQAIDLYG